MIPRFGVARCSPFALLNMSEAWWGTPRTGAPHPARFSRRSGDKMGALNYAQGMDS